MLFIVQHSGHPSPDEPRKHERPRGSSRLGDIMESTIRATASVDEAGGFIVNLAQQPPGRAGEDLLPPSGCRCAVRRAAPAAARPRFGRLCHGRCQSVGPPASTTEGAQVLRLLPDRWNRVSSIPGRVLCYPVLVGFDQGSAAGVHLVVDGMPVTAQLFGGFGGGAASLAGLLCRPPCCPGGQQRPFGVDLGVLFGELPRTAALVGAFPVVFPPAQTGGTTARGKIDQHPPAGCLSTRPSRCSRRCSGRGVRKRTSTSTPPLRVRPPP